MKRNSILRAGALLSSTVVFSILIVSAVSAQAGYLIFMPFKRGVTWKCVQGNNSNYSHYGKLQYAYDFVYAWGDTTSGTFGKNILSPIDGTIIDARTGAPDYQYNDGNYGALNNNGWGNTLLIKDSTTGMYLRFAHMKDGSVYLQVGSKVEINQYIGQVGQSGYSSNPHLHIHMQEGSVGDAQSVEFHFVEGPITTGSYAESEIFPKAFVLDDENDKSLSNWMSSYWSSKSSGWSTPENPIPGATTGITRYFKKLTNTSGSVWYKWNFIPKKSCVYIIVAKTANGPGGDPCVKYTLYRNFQKVFPDLPFCLNQKKEGEMGQKWSYLFGMMPLYEGSFYTLKFEGSTNDTYTLADGLMFIRLSF